MLSGIDVKKVLLAIVLLIVGVAMLVGFIWLIFIQSPQEIELEPDGGAVGPGGILPGTGPGDGTTVVGPDGRLSPEEGRAGTGQGGLRPSQVASGSLTEVSNLVEDRLNEIDLSGSGFNYLSAEDNRFYYLSADGRTKLLLSDDTFPFVEKITWSPDGQKAVLEYPDGANIMYDFNRREKTTLPVGADGFSFNSESNKVAYKFIGENDDENWLVVNEISGRGTKPVAALGNQGNSVQVSWSPDNQVVALYHKATGIDSEEVFFIGLNDENFLSLKVRGFNFKGKWAPDGERILYHVVSAENDYNPVLWIADASLDRIGMNNFNLGLSTWVDKCVFAGSLTVYCAVPVGLSQGAGIYPDLVNDSPDIFYRVNLRTGRSELVAIPISDDEITEFKVKKLFMSDDGTRLYFWDEWSKNVYYMQLR